MTEVTPESPLSGVGGVNIVREKCLREAWARVSFSAHETKETAISCLFSFCIIGNDDSTERPQCSPSRGGGCRYRSRQNTHAKRGCNSRFPLKTRNDSHWVVVFVLHLRVSKFCPKPLQLSIQGLERRMDYKKA